MTDNPVKYTSQTKYRAANRDKINMTKIITNMLAGGKPRQSTLDKYNISISKLNEIRAKHNLKPYDEIDFPQYPNTGIHLAKAVLGDIQVERDKEDKAIQEAEQALRLQKEMTDRIIESSQFANDEVIDAGIPNNKKLDYKSLSIGDIKAFIKERSDNDKINRQTAKGYMSKLNVIARLLSIDHVVNIIPILNEPKKILDIINDKYSNVHSRKGYIQTILYTISNYPLLKSKIADKVYKIYEKAFQESKINEKSVMASKTTLTQISFSDIKKKVDATYPPWSRERLIFELYKSMPARDDFGAVTIVRSEDDAIDPNSNYLVWKGKDTTLILRSYKTVEKYGEIQHKFPSIISEYLVQQKKQYGDPLIGNAKGSFYHGNGGALSALIGSIMRKSGVETGHSAINLIRHAYATEQLSKEPNAEEREKIAKLMMHSPITTLSYVRKFESKDPSLAEVANSIPDITVDIEPISNIKPVNKSSKKKKKNKSK